MIKKSEIIVCAWISLLLEQHFRTQDFKYKDVLFTREEIQSRAESLLGANKIIRPNELLDLTIGKGTNSSSVQKFFSTGGEGALEIYFILCFPNENNKYAIKKCITILLDTNHWDNTTPYNTAEEIENILNSYFKVIKDCDYLTQGSCSKLIAKEAIWIASATISYNEYYRTYSSIQDKYFFAQSEIAKIAHSFNYNNSLDTCRQMTRLDCTEREPYLWAHNQKRRLRHWYEQNIGHPVKHNDFIVVTVNGYKTVSEIISFVKNEYTNMFFSELLSTNNIPEAELETRISSLPNDLLRTLALQRETEAIPQEERTIQLYNRDPYIKQYAKRWAMGICQLCKQPAPFLNTNGEPYLEAHHIVPLSNGGKDSVDNVVALCPNCHRKMHIVKQECDINELLLLAKRASNNNL